MSWFNPDNLLLKFGTEKAVVTPAGEYRNVGQLHEVEVLIDLTTLTQTHQIFGDVTAIPKNARLVEVEVITRTAAATGTAIDLGLLRTSDRTTAIDNTAWLAAYPLASMDAAGEKNVVTIGGTGVGTAIGTTITNPGHIACRRTTATAFTAGLIYCKCRYYAV